MNEVEYDRSATRLTRQRLDALIRCAYRGFDEMLEGDTWNFDLDDPEIRKIEQTVRAAEEAIVVLRRKYRYWE